MVTYALVDLIPERVGNGVEGPVHPLAAVVIPRPRSTECSHLESESASEDRSEEDIIPADEEARRVLEEAVRFNCRFEGIARGGLACRSSFRSVDRVISYCSVINLRAD